MALILATEPILNKQSEYRFEVLYPGAPLLALDFEPLWAAAQELRPCDRLVLLHWQGKPVGQRRFGLFEWDRGTGSYSCCYKPFLVGALHFPLQIAEGETLPTAALFYPGARLQYGTIF